MLRTLCSQFQSARQPKESKPFPSPNSGLSTMPHYLQFNTPVDSAFSLLPTISTGTALHLIAEQWCPRYCPIGSNRMARFCTSCLRRRVKSKTLLASAAILMVVLRIIVGKQSPPQHTISWFPLLQMLLLIFQSTFSTW